MAKRWVRWFAWVAAIGVILALIAGIVLCESAIRVPRKTLPAGPGLGVTWRSVDMTARDGAEMRAWLLLPRKPNGNAVLVLHGIADSRTGTLGLARMLLANGYVVLAPDSRGHGESGGELATYGLLEADDVHRWVDWLIAAEHPRKVFGMGESLGAAVLIQSLAVENRFSAVVAECPFASFSRVAVDRVAQRLPMIPWLGHIVATPLVWSGFAYARVRYGLDFLDASPESVIGRTSTPVLLIHGLKDTNIYPLHSRMLAERNPRNVALWLVPEATHTAAFGFTKQEFEQRVLGWFAEHSR